MDALRDRLVVGQQAAQPTVVDVGLLYAAGVLLDRVLALLLGADEQHRAAPLRDVADVVIGVLEHHDRLLKIDDVDAAALAEDEPAHLRVPAPRLVAEVDSGFEQLSHGDCGHAQSPPCRIG